MFYTQHNTVSASSTDTVPATETRTQATSDFTAVAAGRLAKRREVLTHHCRPRFCEHSQLRWRVPTAYSEDSSAAHLHATAEVSPKCAYICKRNNHHSREGSWATHHCCREATPAKSQRSANQ